MKKILLAGTAGALLLSSPAFAADPFTVQLKWVTQAQFAGYFVAQEMGYYDEYDLDVTIKPGGPDISPVQVLVAGGADVVVNWMPEALAAREQGVDLVNVAQFYDRSGMMLTCLAESGIEGPEDFADKTLGVWFFGNEYPFLSWMSQLGYATDGSAGGVTVLRQSFNVDPLLQRQADCISTMIYNEYWQVIDAGIPEDELVTFFYEDQGVATLEDGLYALESDLADPEYVDRLERFIAATIKGWAYAAENPAEAAEIVLEFDESGATTFEVQARQMENVATLLNTDPATIGYLDPEAFARTVDVLLSGDSDPVITEDPGEAAWTHGPWEGAVGRL